MAVSHRRRGVSIIWVVKLHLVLATISVVIAHAMVVVYCIMVMVVIVVMIMVVMVAGVAICQAWLLCGRASLLHAETQRGRDWRWSRRVDQR